MASPMQLAASMEIIAGCVATLLGSLILVTGWARLENRFLGAFLMLHGMGPLGITRGIGRFLMASQETAAAGLVWSSTSEYPDDLSWLLYLGFLGLAIGSPLLRPFGSRIARWALLPIGALLVGNTWAVLHWAKAVPEASRFFPIISVAVPLLGLAGAVHAFRLADDEREKVRMRRYLASFSIFEIGYVGPSLVFRLSELGVLSPRFTQADHGAYASIIILQMAILGVGITAIGLTALRGHVIDLGRRIHFTVSRGSLAAIFVAVFITVQEVVGEYVSQTAGLAGGALATLVLVLGLDPLMRMSRRIADAAAPDGGAAERMADDERYSIYMEQASVAWSDGIITGKEIEALRRLRARLAMPAEEADLIELRVQQARAASLGA